MDPRQDLETWKSLLTAVALSAMWSPSETNGSWPVSHQWMPWRMLWKCALMAMSYRAVHGTCRFGIHAMLPPEISPNTFRSIDPPDLRSTLPMSDLENSKSKSNVSLSTSLQTGFCAPVCTSTLTILKYILSELFSRYEFCHCFKKKPQRVQH